MWTIVVTAEGMGDDAEAAVLRGAQRAVATLAEELPAVGTQVELTVTTPGGVVASTMRVTLEHDRE